VEGMNGLSRMGPADAEVSGLVRRLPPRRTTKAIGEFAADH
jgi:hypothetical protein